MSVKGRVLDLNSLYKSVKNCKRGVRYKMSVIQYTHNALINITKLKNDIENGIYKPIEGPSFKIFEPKERVVTSTLFKDRVPQRSIVDYYLKGQLDKHLIDENCACREKRGTDYARNILKKYLRDYYKNHGCDGYYLKLDIKKYFPSIEHEIAKQSILPLTDDYFIQKCIIDVIDSNEGDVGIGLGSQINQYIAISVLNDIDHLVKDDLCCEMYARYMDDIVIISEDKERLKFIKDVIQIELSKLKLRLNEKKSMICRLNQPIHFLGFSYKLHPTGKVTQRLLRKTITKKRRKLRAQARQVKLGNISIDEFEIIYKSGRGHIKKGTRSDLFKLDKYFKNLLEELKCKTLLS